MKRAVWIAILFAITSEYAQAFQQRDMISNREVSDSSLLPMERLRYVRLTKRSWVEDLHIYESLGIEGLSTTGTYRIMLPDGESVQARTQETRFDQVTGIAIWMGSFGDGHVVWPLVFSSSGVWGEVYIGDERWALRGIGRGKTAVFRTDDSEAPPEEPAGWLSRMAVSKIASADSAAKRTGKGDQRGRNRILTGDPEIKVLLLYSEETSDNIESEVATAEAYANTSFTNSRLDFISVDIVAVEVEPLHEPTVSQNGVDSLQAGLVYENVETLRTSYNADIVGYVSMDNNARGIAKEILASASNAYVIVSKDFLPSLTFTHEIGHLAGALHTASWMQGYIPGYVWNDSEDNPWGASLGSYSNHAVDSYFLGSHHLSVMTTSLSRLPYWSSFDDGAEGTGAPYDWEPSDQDDVHYVGDSDKSRVREVWLGRVDDVTGWKGTAQYPPPAPDPRVLASVSGPTSLAWHETGTLYGSATYVDDPYDPETCGDCTFEWYENWVGSEGWYIMAETSDELDVSMTWTEGHWYRLVIYDAVDDLWDEEDFFLEYCSSNCGAKRGGDDTSRRDLIPSDIVLHPAYPNPFSKSTTIEFILDEPKEIALTVFDVMGREVQRLVNSALPEGLFKFNFSPADELANGLYFYRLQSDDATRVGKLIFVR